MQATPLSANLRTIVGKKVRNLRREGQIPATVYGKDVKSTNLSLSIKDFASVFSKVGETGLVELSLEGKKLPTLITNVQSDPVSRQVLHAEFHAVNLKEKIKANVPLEIVGESPAVLNGLGVVLQTLNEVEVEALPGDLPEKIFVEAGGLSQVDDQVTVGELTVPQGVALITSETEIVVKVAPAVLEEVKEVEKEEAITPEGETGGEKESQEPTSKEGENKSTE